MCQKMPKTLFFFMFLEGTQYIVLSCYSSILLDWMSLLLKTQPLMQMLNWLCIDSGIFFLSERRLKAFKIWSTSLLADPSFISLYKPLRERFVKESFVNFAAPKNQKATTIKSLAIEQHRADHHFIFLNPKSHSITFHWNVFLIFHLTI